MLKLRIFALPEGLG